MSLEKTPELVTVDAESGITNEQKLWIAGINLRDKLIKEKRLNYQLLDQVIRLEQKLLELDILSNKSWLDLNNIKISM